MTYIKIFTDCLDAIAPLDDGERGRLFTALLRYARTGEVSGLQGNERILFPMLRAQLDRDAASYTELCEMNRQKGAKGGRPPKKAAAFSESRESQEEEKEKEKEEDKDKDKEKDKDNSSYGAGGPVKRKSGRRGNRPDSPVEVRRNMDRMDKFLEQLRQEAEGAS